MTMLRIAAIFFLAVLTALPVTAGEIKPFVRGSIKEITSVRQGKPFILGFWSLTCTHCRDELALLSKLSRQYPKLEMVLVSTDTPQDAEDVAATLKQFSLDLADGWVFADGFADRLRFEIDRKWHGELPRTYLYDPSGNFTAFSGSLDSRQLERWAHNYAGN